MAKVKPTEDTRYTPDKTTRIGAVNANALLPGITREVEAELTGQIAPIQADIADLTRREGRASTDIASLFTNLQGVVDASTGRLRGDTEQALSTEKAIFQEAQNRLGQLSAQRAADAQSLAQQLGIDVPLEGLFRGQADFESSLFAGEAGTRLLTAGMTRQNALDAAEAFSGRVFPLLRAEETTKSMNYFRDEVTKRQAEIKALKGTKKGQINAKLRERLIQERQYSLDKATANRNWWLAVKGLELERDRIQTDLSTTQAQIDSTAEQTRVQVGENAKDRKAREAAQKRELALEKKKLGLNKDDFRLKQRQNIVAIVNAAVSPGKDIATVTVPVSADEFDPDAINIGTAQAPQWVKYVDQKQNFGAQAETNPNRIVDMVMSQLGLNKKKNAQLYNYMLQTIKDRFRAAGTNIDKWVYGQAVPWQQPTQGRAAVVIVRDKKTGATRKEAPGYTPTPTEEIVGRTTGRIPDRG